MNKTEFRYLVVKLKDDAMGIDLKKLPSEVLSELLQLAVERIDQIENAYDMRLSEEDFCNYDERDAGDIVFDQNYIIYELLDDLLERIDQGLIKEE